MVKNVKANCDLVSESIETSLKTKKKWILIREHWYKLEQNNKTLKKYFAYTTTNIISMAFYEYQTCC